MVPEEDVSDWAKELLMSVVLAQVLYTRLSRTEFNSEYLPYLISVWTGSECSPTVEWVHTSTRWNEYAGRKQEYHLYYVLKGLFFTNRVDIFNWLLGRNVYHCLRHHDDPLQGVLTHLAQSPPRGETACAQCVIDLSAIEGALNPFLSLDTKTLLNAYRAEMVAVLDQEYVYSHLLSSSYN